MIKLDKELSLGSLVLSRGSVLTYSYVLPQGMTFPAGTSGELRVTDRAGGEYDNSPFAGTVSPDNTQMNWSIPAVFLDHIPAGANFEVFVAFDGKVQKVRYGRVVRKEVAYPLDPRNVEVPPMLYEDDMQRSMPGPRWLIKGGRMSMQAVTGVYGGVNYPVGYAMAARNKTTDIWGNALSVFSESGAQWYAPLQSDKIEMSVGLADNNNGECTVCFASNYSMGKFLGVRFLNPWTFGEVISGARYQHQIQVVYGTAWDSVATVGSYINYTFPTTGSLFRIVYDGPGKSVTVYTPASGTVPAMITSTASTAIQTGAGFRYMGFTSKGNYQYTGPRLYYWKAKDIV